MKVKVIYFFDIQAIGIFNKYKYKKSPFSCNERNIRENGNPAKETSLNKSITENDLSNTIFATMLMMIQLFGEQISLMENTSCFLSKSAIAEFPRLGIP